MSYLATGIAGAVTALLGSSPLESDYNADGAQDGITAYRQWVAAVKAGGGTVWTYPFHQDVSFSWYDLGGTDVYGLPAARYPWSRVYAEGGALRPPFTAEPDNSVSTPTGSYCYYLAPLSILKWAAGGGLSTLDGGGVTDQTPPELKPNWYNALTTTGRYVALGAGALALVALLSYLPRPRDWE